MTQFEHAMPRPVSLAADRASAWRIQPQLALPFLGMGAWAYGASQIEASKIGNFGLLVSSNIWFVLGIVALVTGFVLELRRSEPRYRNAEATIYRLNLARIGAEPQSLTQPHAVRN